jgi:hypothetical protein
MMDWLSPISAVVKIRLRVHENVFAEHPGFENGESRWRVVSKIWHLEKWWGWLDGCDPIDQR